VGFAAPASAAVMVDDFGSYGIMEAPYQESSAEISLSSDSYLSITGVLGTELSNVTLSGPGSTDIASASFTGSDIPGAFAGMFELTGGETYLLSTGSTDISAVAFNVSEVPIPGAALLLGTAVAGLGMARARRKAA
jgi:hypothetical protein